MNDITTENVDQLIQAARQVAENAYQPYSKFTVGSAVLTPSGEIFSGCNVENASYGLTICAERSAIVQAVSKGHRELVAVAVYTPTQFPNSPCGACRQFIREFGPMAEIICICDGPDILRHPLEFFLPESFGPEKL